ncbi:MAG: metalloenzyme [Candidatus Aegiribacteria sp.]
MFLDGVGLGPGDADRNPFASVPTPTLDAVAGGTFVAPRTGLRAVGRFERLDATLGVAGLPQSATGQSALLTGRNAASAMDGHYGPWPGPTLKRLLDEGQLFGWAAERFGLDAVAWGGAYPPGFFDALERGRLRLNAPAYAARSAGVLLPGEAAYRDGSAVAADLDGAWFASRGIEPPGGFVPGPAGAERAGERLATAAAGKAFAFLDVWLTDRIGHRGTLDEGRDLVRRLDAFVAGVLRARDPTTTVVITSDHGNVEDLAHRRHTRADVPLIVVGPGEPAFDGAASILDVAPAVRAVWEPS